MFEGENTTMFEMEAPRALASRTLRCLLLGLSLAFFFASVAAVQPGSPSLRNLLLRSDGTIPSATEIADASSDGLSVPRDVLLSTKCPRAWPAAVIALAVLSKPGVEADRVLHDLKEFQSTLSPFGCVVHCRPRKLSPVAMEWDAKARSTVILALSYLLRKEEPAAGNARKGQSIALANNPLQILTDIGIGYEHDLQFPWLSTDERKAKVQKLELQLKAVQALQESGRSDAKASLVRISKEATSALVRSQAERSLESFR